MCDVPNEDDCQRPNVFTSGQLVFISIFFISISLLLLNIIHEGWKLTVSYTNTLDQSFSVHPECYVFVWILFGSALVNHNQ